MFSIFSPPKNCTSTSSRDVEWPPDKQSSTRILLESEAETRDRGGFRSDLEAVLASECVVFSSQDGKSRQLFPIPFYLA